MNQFGLEMLIYITAVAVGILAGILIHILTNDNGPK